MSDQLDSGGGPVASNTRSAPSSPVPPPAVQPTRRWPSRQVRPQLPSPVHALMSSPRFAGNTRLDRAARARESALDSSLSAFCGTSMGNSSFRAASLLIRRPGLTITSSQRRLALGRAHGPALISPRRTENGPSRLARSGATLWLWASPAGASTTALSHPGPALPQRNGPGDAGPLPPMPSYR